METEGFWKLWKNISKQYLKQQEIRRWSKRKIVDEAEGVQLKKKEKEMKKLDEVLNSAAR